MKTRIEIYKWDQLLGKYYEDTTINLPFEVSMTESYPGDGSVKVVQFMEST